MNEKIKKKWVDALRSGKYKQGREQLRDGDKFCCLGVLCEVLRIPYRPRDPYLPPRARDLAGLKQKDPLVQLRGRALMAISNLNDGNDVLTPPLRRRTFEQIADVIEKQL